MSDYISKSEVIKSIRRKVVIASEEELDLKGEIVELIKNQPTLDEKEIIRKAFERVLEKLKEMKEDCDCYGHLKKKGLIDWVIEILKEECGINE